MQKSDTFLIKGLIVSVIVSVFSIESMQQATDWARKGTAVAKRAFEATKRQWQQMPDWETIKAVGDWETIKSTGKHLGWAIERTLRDNWKKTLIKSLGLAGALGFALKYPDKAIKLAGGAWMLHALWKMISTAIELADNIYYRPSVSAELISDEDKKVAQNFKDAFEVFKDRAAQLIVLASLYNMYKGGSYIWRSGLSPSDMLQWIKKQSPQTFKHAMKNNPVAATVLTTGAIASVPLYQFVQKTLAVNSIMQQQSPQDDTLKQAVDDVRSAYNRLQTAAFILVQVYASAGVTLGAVKGMQRMQKAK